MLKDINLTLTLNRYRDRFPEDDPSTDSLISLIADGGEVISRKEFKGHVTCGAILLNNKQNLLMIHHIILDKWLFPGGHIEGGDSSLREAALRELTEETGIEIDAMGEFNNWADDIPIHIDCHPIPENKNKREPRHQHWDFRFLFKTDEACVTIQEEEVKGFNWVSQRMAPKIISERIRATGVS